MIHKKHLPKIKKTSQERSEAAVDNILESADLIFSENDHKKLTARNLAEKSGYSVGNLYYYLNKAEDAFILMLFKRREKRFLHLAEIINAFPANQPLINLVQALVDGAFEEFNRMNQKSFFVIFKMIIRFSKNPFILDDALLVLVEPLMLAQQKNTTKTFRQIDAEDLLLILKACIVMQRRPFLEGSPIAGTQKHRELMIYTMVRLLGN